MKKHIYKNITTASMEAVEEFWGRRQIAIPFVLFPILWSIEKEEKASPL